MVLETVKVIAKDACGFWIEHEVVWGAHRSRWTFCVANQPAADAQRLYESLWALVERQDGFVVGVDDIRSGWTDRTRFTWLVELVHAPWAGHTELPREDITTPDGQFAQAVKTTSKRGAVEITQWSHPEVPLGGLVREVSTDDHERVLLQHGTSNPESSFVADGEEHLRIQQRQRVRSPAWVAFEVEYASLGKIDEMNQAFGFEGAGGARVAPKIDVVFGTEVIGSAPYENDSTLNEDMLAIQAGLRWMPFGRSTWSRPRLALPASSFWFQADLGYAELDRGREGSSTSTVGRGALAGARAGVVLAQGRDWTYGLQLYDHVALLNSDEGLRHIFGVSSEIQLFFF